MEQPVKIPRTGKFEAIRDKLLKEIAQGLFPAGSQLPTEQELARHYRVSRPTAAKALNELERGGAVRRIPGAGTFVTEAPAVHAAGRHLFGLLIPGLGFTEIFEPICGRMAACARAAGCTLLWGGCDAGTAENSPEALAADYVRRRIAGVFFAPLELIPEAEARNRRILDLLERAGIPVVLLDRDALPYPERSRHDLVALDGLRAAYTLTRHLAGRGCRRIHFLVRPFAASTTGERLAGYRSALLDAGLAAPEDAVHCRDPEDPELVEQLLDSQADAVIASNDANAAALLRQFARRGVAVPERIRVTGFDDLACARHVTPALTTVRQPCADIGQAALAMMLERLDKPDQAPQTILLPGELIVRDSS